MKLVPTSLLRRSLSGLDCLSKGRTNSEALNISGAGVRLALCLPKAIDVYALVFQSGKLLRPPVFLHTRFVARKRFVRLGNNVDKIIIFPLYGRDAVLIFKVRDAARGGVAWLLLQSPDKAP